MADGPFALPCRTSKISHAPNMQPTTQNRSEDPAGPVCLPWRLVGLWQSPELVFAIYLAAMLGAIPVWLLFDLNTAGHVQVIATMAAAIWILQHEIRLRLKSPTPNDEPRP